LLREFCPTPHVITSTFQPFAPGPVLSSSKVVTGKSHPAETFRGLAWTKIKNINCFQFELRRQSKRPKHAHVTEGHHSRKTVFLAAYIRI
jgi:hypothetical protein